MANTLTHLVVPGQIIAEGDDFLRGHGTYVESKKQKDGGGERLVASVAGRIERVNKLVSVIPVSSSVYRGHVGDLVIGRITSVQNTRWRVLLGENAGKLAQLPLSGVHLPGGVQRMRTQQDSREMRKLFQEGDLVCAEVHNVGNNTNDNSISLHTRSLVRYGKLENGCLIVVPPSLVPRRKNHFVVMAKNTISLVLGNNGYIWIQRALPHDQEEGQGDDNSNEANKSTLLLAEHQEKIHREHKETPVLPDERYRIARIRNSIECLSKVHLLVSPENITTVYEESIKIFPDDTTISGMLHPQNILILTRPMMK